MIIYKNFNLRNYSTIKVESVCNNFFEVEKENDVAGFCKEKKDFFVLGKGSNTLFAKEMKDVLYFGKNFSETDFINNTVLCQSGKSIVSLAKQAADSGLSGLEFASGIPASLGGAIAMNAGAFGSDFSKITKEVIAFDCITQKIIKFCNAECKFGYRRSVFSKNLIVLSATLELKQSNKKEIAEKMRENLSTRKLKQPVESFSLGSIFLSENYSAAKLIDEAGLKGFSVGGAEVSKKHSGFIINRGGATQEDVVKLIEIIKQNVYEKFNILLKEEIKIV